MSGPHESSRPPGPRQAATRIARALADAGHTAYFAGGCVRDRLLGIEPKDYDVATSARPEEVRAVFPRARGVGESFGVMLVRHRRHTVEVATFRTDGIYSDGRHPDEIAFSDAEHDARRRDFTMNGLFEDPFSGEIIDHVGGREDLERRLVRAIGEPARRFAEDRLRMLRAVRFAARFQFAIESDTAEAIRAGAGDLRGVSRERIGQELRLMLTDANRAVAAWEIQYLGLDALVLEEPPCTAAPVRLARLADATDYPTTLAAWLLDRAPPGEGLDIDASVERWTGALMLSNAEARGVRAALLVHRTLRERWTRLGVAAQKRLAAGEGFAGALALLCAEDAASFVAVHRQLEELRKTGLAPEPLITGDDLISARMKPGPIFKRVLDGVYDAQLEGSVTTRIEALTLARAILEAHGQRE